MKTILKIIIIAILSMNGTCSQNAEQEVNQKASQILNCEWSINPEYDQADVIIFRSDSTYLIYDELDYEGLEPEKHKYNIFFDDGIIRTALVESGNWTYNTSNNQIILKDRDFIKENSEFNSFHGKGKKIVFSVKKLTDKELVLCSAEKESFCDTYIKNPNYAKNKNRVFYREVIETYSGKGSQTKGVLLSGYETKLKVTYEFNKESDQLIIEDRSGRKLFTATMTTANESEEITLQGATKLSFKVKTSSLDTRWKFKVEIK